MRFSLPISFAVHVSILVFAAGVLSSPDAYQVEDQESIPVEIVDIEDFTKRQAQKPDIPEPKPEEKPGIEVKKEPEITKIEPKPAEEIKQAAKEPTPAPQPEPEPAPAPEPEQAEPEPPQPDPVEELIKQTEQAEPEPAEKTAEAVPVPKPRVKPKPPAPKVVEKKKKKKPAFDTNDVAALLNKIDDERAAPPDPDEAGTPALGDIASLLGSDDGISATELDWLRQQIGRCWNIPAGVREAHNLIVRVQIQMDPSGNVLGQPVVLNNSSHPAFGAAARSSVAAVMGCQPYDRLPVEKYASWKNIIINFDPSKMLAIN